ADEALQGAEQRPVNHRRGVLTVICRGVGEPKALGHLQVELNGPELPAAAERVGHVQVDLGTVERAVARIDRVLELPRLESPLQRSLGEVPLVLRSELVIRTGGELDARVDLELVVQEEGVVQAAEQLVVDLLARTEDVRVILDKVADAQKAVEDARELVA